MLAFVWDGRHFICIRSNQMAHTNKLNKKFSQDFCKFYIKIKIPLEYQRREKCVILTTMRCGGLAVA